MAQHRDDSFSDTIRLQDAARAVGFDWNDPSEMWGKLREELGELEEAVGQGPARTLDEFGDLLFMMVNLARHLDVDPAAALRGACDKFNRRFGHVMAAADTLPPIGSPERLDAMEARWQEAKKLGL